LAITLARDSATIVWMGVGPITIYDKSALQSLSMDEAVWLDAFFLVNISPLFYVETLADLEKEVARGKSPEDLVGMLAAKTPPNAVPNVHHRSLVATELAGRQVPMDGRVPIAGWDLRRTTDGGIGAHVDEFDEAVALNRWRDHEFLEIERAIAKRWRSDLADPERDRKIAIMRNILPVDTRISDLAALKLAIDAFCMDASQEIITLALDILGVHDDGAREIIARWQTAGRPNLESFAPYTTHVFKVDLVYYLGVDRGFISGERASNKADMAYLYYLPFCMIFTSGDKLHRRTAPLFLRADQSFVDASVLKAALHRLDDYYDRLPDEIKALGVMAFAPNPPTDIDNLVADLWDKHMRPEWRDGAKTPEEAFARLREQERGGAAAFRARIERAQPAANLEAQLTNGAPDYVVIQRKVPVRKGKWRLVPEQIEHDEGDADGAH
jgi:hypothetical protein